MSSSTRENDFPPAMTMSLLVRSSGMILLTCTGPPDTCGPGGCSGMPGWGGCICMGSPTPSWRAEPGLAPVCAEKISVSFCASSCAPAYCTGTMWISSDPPGWSSCPTSFSSRRMFRPRSEMIRVSGGKIWKSESREVNWLSTLRIWSAST